jgi:hypothetical protein
MSKYLVYQWPGHSPPTLPEIQPSMRWVTADASLIEKLFVGEPDRLRAQSEMLAQGYVGLVCIAGNEWCAYAWMRRPRSPGPPHLPAEARHRPCYWITYCRTKREFQRRGLFSAAILRLVAAALAEDPSANILIDAASSNHVSQMGITRAGFSPSGVVRTVSIGISRIGHVVVGSWRPQ